MVSKKSKKGFTLVELIVVIAIIAILAAVAIPTTIVFVHKAKISSQKQSASSATRTIVTEFTDFSNDPNMKMPTNPDELGEKVSMAIKNELSAKLKDMNGMYVTFTKVNNKVLVSCSGALLNTDSGLKYNQISSDQVEVPSESVPTDLTQVIFVLGADGSAKVAQDDNATKKIKAAIPVTPAASATNHQG